MKPKKIKAKLSLNKLTISNLEKSNVKGGAPVTYWCSQLCSENPGCDTRADCGNTVNQPYLCPSVAPYPGCCCPNCGCPDCCC